MKRIRQTSLGFCEGSSDKVYEAELLELGPNQYLVNFRYGKRGASLREGSKTPAPVAFEPAAKLFKSLLVEKINKGYELVSGFDPLADELRAPTAPAASSFDPAAHALGLLRAYAGGERPDQRKPAEASLGRCVRRAGEIGLVAAAELLPQLIAPAATAGSRVLNYSIAWALGRLGQPESLAHLPRLREVLPASHASLLTEVELALTPPEQRIALIEKLRRPDCETPADFAAAQAALNDASRAAEMHLVLLSDQDLAFHRHALKWRGLDTELQPLLDRVELGTEWNDFYAALPPALQQRLSAEGHRSAPLLAAIRALVSHFLQLRKQALLGSRESDLRLFRMALKGIDLKKRFGSPYFVNYIQQERFGWIHGSARDQLVEALNKTGLIPDAQTLFERLAAYESLDYINGRELGEDELAHHQARLAAEGYLEEFNATLVKSSMDDLRYGFEQRLGPELRSKLHGTALGSLETLVWHQRALIKLQVQREADALQARFNEGLLALYRKALLDADARELLLGLVSDLAIGRYGFQILRRLCKLAEFRGDSELLALLYQRFESSMPLPSPYWESRTKAKPFGRPTRDYLRRRLPRVLRQLAQHRPEKFPALAAEVLLQVRDGEACFAPRTVKRSRWYRDASNRYQRRSIIRNYPEFATHLGLNYLLYANSLRYRPVKGGLAWVEVATNAAENPRPEAHPELWDQQPEQALRVLLGARARIVDAFARGLLQRQPEFCTQIALNDWLLLVQRPYADTARLALAALASRIDAPGVLEALLASPLSDIRGRGLELLNAPAGLERFSRDPGLALVLLCSPYADLREFLTTHAEKVASFASELCAAAVHRLMAIVDASMAESVDVDDLLSGAEALLTGALRGRTPLGAIESVLNHKDSRLQRLGARLLNASDFAYAELAGLLTPLRTADEPELRAAALRLLSRLPIEARAAQIEALMALLLGDEPALAAAARELLSGLDVAEAQGNLFAALVPLLFRSQAEGPGEDLLALVAGMDNIYTGIDKHLPWRLLTARSKLAQQAGSLIVVARDGAEYSLRQLVTLSRHASVGVRRWSLGALRTDARTFGDFETVLGILDNPWDDARAEAIAWLATLPAETWTPERTVLVCDQVYDDVQRLGRDLVSGFFATGQGEFYLLRLSQHPSRRVQLFVSGLLEGFAEPDLLLALRPYFVTVLAQVNRGRVVKDRVLRQLGLVAKTSPPIAAMLSELLSEHSLSSVTVDKARSLEALLELQRQAPELASPLRVIPPRKAVL